MYKYFASFSSPAYDFSIRSAYGEQFQAGIIAHFVIVCQFVERTLEGAHIAPELLPRSIVVANIERQLALYRALSPVVARMTSLAEQIEDTHSQVGSEVYTQALEMYRHFKAAGRTEGLDELIDNMGKRFNGQGRKKKTPPKDE